MAAPDHRPLADGAVYDVVVVGARAAGAATALLLARHGLRTLVLDRGEPGTDTVSTHALMRGGVLQLSRWGVLPAVVAAGTPPIRRTTFRYGGEELGISIKPSPGVDALYAPRRTVLDPLLVQAAAAAGADVRYRTRVTEVLRSNGRVVGLRAGTPGQPPVDVRASLVVGADGMHSAIARLVGAPTVRQGVHTTAVTYGYWSDLPTDGYEWIFHPDACSGVIPTNGGQACVFASASPARIGRGGLDVVHQVVAEGDPELAARLRLATAPSGTRTWSGLRGYLRQASGPGWALVGDAGYLKDPISAHGLTDALRDAELLARAVAEAFDHTAMLDHALAGALADYQATRDRLSVGLFDVVDRIASQQWDTVEIGALLLQLSSAMAEEIELLGQLDEPAAA